MWSWALKLAGGNSVVLYVVVALITALGLSWAGAGVAGWYLKGQIDKRDREIRALEREKGLLETEKAQARAAAKECSESVIKLELRLKARSAELQRARDEADKRSRVLQGQIQDILVRPRPQGLTACENADKELNDEIDSRVTGTLSYFWLQRNTYPSSRARNHH